MTIGVRYAPHEGPPRDVTIRCEVWIAIEADGYEGDDPASTADPVGFVEWREVFEAAYSLEGVSRLDRAAVDSVEWENPCRVVVSLTLDITLLGEDESLSTLAQRFSSDWEIHNDSFDLPEPWQAFVGGRCKALMPEVGPDADQGGGRSGDAGVSDGPVRSQDVLNYRTYAAFRRGIGDPAFWLEGIAALGRSRAASLRGVGKTALEEVDAALATHGMRWADPSEPIPSQGRPLPGDALSGQGNGRGSLDSEVLGPGRALVSRIVKAADDGRDDEVEELLAAFDETIAELLPEGDLRAEMLVDRVVRGRTLDEIGVRFNITRERVRQKLDPLDGRGFTAIQRSRARTFLASNREEVRHRYRTGLSVQEVVESFLQDHPGLPVGSVKTTIAEQLLFTTRDKSIRWLMRRPASRPAHQQWSNSEILAAIRRVATDHCGGTAPTVTDYDEARELWRGSDGNPEIPSRQLITDRFRSWNRARVLAGFPVPITGHRSDKKWPAERVLSRVFALVRELDELPSVQRFDAIREAGLNQQSVEPLPAAVTVRKELSHDQLGKWDDLRAMIYQSLIDLGEWTV